MLDLAAEKTPWIFDSVVVTKAGLQSNADGIERFIKAYIEAEVAKYVRLAKEAGIQPE